MNKNLDMQMLMTMLTYEVFFEMCKNPKLTFLEATNIVIDYNNIKPKVPNDIFASNMLKYSLGSIVRQCFVLQKEEIDIGDLDESLKVNKNYIVRTREKLAGKNIGNLQLYKLIREAFVHNNPENPNFYIDEKLHFHFNIKQKKQEPFHLELYLNDIATLLTTFNSNYENKQKITYVYEKDLDAAIKNNTLFLGNMDDLVYSEINGVKQETDKYQKSAFFNFLYKTSPIYEGMYHIPVANWQIVSGHFPSKNNSANLFLDNMKLIGLFPVVIKNVNKTIVDYLKEYTNKFLTNHCPFREFIIAPIRYDICDTLLIANMFNLVMSIDNESLKSTIKNAGYNYTDDEIRHLRNSLAHGRYFYTYDMYNGIEVYDGTDSLEHIKTVSMDDLYMILNHYLNEIVDDLEP